MFDARTRTDVGLTLLVNTVTRLRFPLKQQNFFTSSLTFRLSTALLPCLLRREHTVF